MNNEKLSLRFVQEADAPVLLEIYRPHVESEDRKLSDVSFEFVAPDVAEFTKRIQTISAKFPYLVLEQAGKILGYAYAHPYAERAAYQWSVELSIYLAPEGQNKGYGVLMTKVMEKLLALQQVTNLYACITKSNAHSIKMYEKLGYKINAVFTNCAFKKGHWLDMVWMEKELPHPEVPELVKSIHEVDEELIKAILADI